MPVEENRRQFRSTLLRGWRSLSCHRHDLALGIERIGLVSLRFPAVVGVLAILLAITAAFGVTRIESVGRRAASPFIRSQPRDSDLVATLAA
jgi:hypothetical protein